MEPPGTAVEAPDGDAAPPAQEVLESAVAAVDRLDVPGAPNLRASKGVDAQLQHESSFNSPLQLTTSSDLRKCTCSIDVSFSWVVPSSAVYSHFAQKPHV